MTAQGVPVVLKATTIKCRCGKHFYLNEVDAQRAERFYAKRHGKTNPVRFYECRFKGWHWTSKVA